MKEFNREARADLYKAAWAYCLKKIDFNEVKKVREEVVNKYNVTREEMMKVWKVTFRWCYSTIYLETPY